MWKTITLETFLWLLLNVSGSTQENKRLNEPIRLKNFYAVNSFLKANITATDNYRQIYESILLNAFGKADSSALLLALPGNIIVSDSLLLKGLNENVGVYLIRAQARFDKV